MYIIPSSEFEVEFLKSGGKLETYEVEIPEEFGLDKFTDNNISYVSDNVKKYENPLDNDNWIN
jgi:hypothetical protein